MKNIAPAAGELALILGFAVRRKNYRLLTQTIRSLGTDCSEPDAKWALTQSKEDLNTQQQDWLEANLRQLYHDPKKARKLPVYSYLWEKKGTLPLDAVTLTRLTATEKQQIDAIAKSKNLSSSELIRDVLRSYLSELPYTGRIE